MLSANSWNRFISATILCLRNPAISCFLSLSIIRQIRVIRVQKQESRHPSALFHLPSYILHLTSRRSSLQLPASRGTAIARLCRLLPKGRKNAGGIYCPLASCAPLVLRRAELGVRRNPVWRDSSNVKRERAVGDGYGIETVGSDRGILLGIILNFCHFLSDLMGLTLEVKSEE